MADDSKAMAGTLGRYTFMVFRNKKAGNPEREWDYEVYKDGKLWENAAAYSSYRDGAIELMLESIGLWPQFKDRLDEVRNSLEEM